MKLKVTYTLETKTTNEKPTAAGELGAAYEVAEVTIRDDRGLLQMTAQDRDPEAAVRKAKQDFLSNVVQRLPESETLDGVTFVKS